MEKQGKCSLYIQSSSHSYLGYFMEDDFNFLKFRNHFIFENKHLWFLVSWCIFFFQTDRTHPRRPLSFKVLFEHCPWKRSCKSTRIGFLLIFISTLFELTPILTDCEEPLTSDKWIKLSSFSSSCIKLDCGSRSAKSDNFTKVWARKL